MHLLLEKQVGDGGAIYQYPNHVEYGNNIVTKVIFNFRIKDYSEGYKNVRTRSHKPKQDADHYINFY